MSETFCVCSRLKGLLFQSRLLVWRDLGGKRCSLHICQSDIWSPRTHVPFTEKRMVCCCKRHLALARLTLPLRNPLVGLSQAEGYISSEQRSCRSASQLLPIIPWAVSPRQQTSAEASTLMLQRAACMIKAQSPFTFLFKAHLHAGMVSWFPDPFGAS